MASAVRSESLSSYLRQIGGRPQLTREQEYELARRARKGDTSARDTLALSNLPFVV
ncbi:MAG: sigma-70 factor domain-containing protein, partial [Myxococcaceae bacterium]